MEGTGDAEDAEMDEHPEQTEHTEMDWEGVDDPSALRAEIYRLQRMQTAGGPSSGSLSSGSLAPLHSLDQTRFQPMSDWGYATWRLGLKPTLANAAVIKPEQLEKLEIAWEQARSAFESTGANSLQFISFIERNFPFEFNLLVRNAKK